MMLNNQWVNNKIKEEIKRHLETNENTTTQEFMGHSQSNSKREIHSLPQETRKISNKQFILTPK